jgi:Na+-translocating ferredoxin:NAD+ oxidoreductase RnfC subunit
MGYVENDWNQPVTKTTSGIIVLKNDHYLIRVKTNELEREAALARAVCCQCNFCTILCPRNALGLQVEPHKMMRAIGLGDMSLAGNPEGIISCCDCGICTYYACNFGLTPSRFMNKGKRELLQGGFRSTKTLRHDVDKARDILRVPADRFLKRLHVEMYDRDAPMADGVLKVRSVSIPLRQHIGVPAEPVVQAGDRVTAGTVIAAAVPDKLCVNIHASITGTVTEVANGQITIESAN